MLCVQLASKHSHEDPIKKLTSAAAYAMRVTVHGVTQCAPAQLVYSRDMILQTMMTAQVELIQQQRERATSRNNTQENKRQIAHQHKVGDRIIIPSGGLDPKLQLNQGPYRVIGYNQASGTLHIQQRNCAEPVNIQNF